jgi:hypothetical protein
MPLCPQITNTPITVTQTADFTVSSVLPVVAATTTQLAEVEVLVDGKAEIFYQTTAPVGATVTQNDLWYDTDDGNKPYVFRSGVWVSAQDGSIATAQSAANTALANAAIADAKGVAAQADATEALADAAIAYSAAIGSLQPSANTIVNASNQMTAINSGGITVYSGASASSGARVVLNSLGLAGFNSGGTATFSISATTGAAVFSGSVTGSTITGGTLNIGGNAIIDASGFLTATGATVTGTITSSNVTITGGTLTIGSKFSVTNTGVLTATDGVFTGTITSTNATITGGSLTVGSTFSVTSAGVLTATSGTIGGSTLSASTITGGTIRTAASGASVSLDGANNALKFTNSSGTAVGWILPYSSNGMVFNYGASPSAGFSAFPAIAIGSTSIILQPDATNSLTIGSTGVNASSLSVVGEFNGPTITSGTSTSSSTSQTSGVYISSTGALIARRDNIIPIFAHRWNASGTSELIRLVYNGADAGGITTTSGGVPAFRNASDYRLKQNIQSFDSAASIIKQINLRSFEFIKDPEEPQVGFIAHELAEVLPALVMGEKDAIDEDGNPAYQSILATNLIPYLTGALKEAILRIEALEGA